ncbi:P-loop NTPase fold protein [Bacillus cereus]
MDNEENIENIESIDDYLVKGQEYVRQKMHKLWGGSWQKGISVSGRYNYIFIFTSNKEEKYGYKNGWRNDGYYYYTGEGQAGDMEFTHGNIAIRDHILSGRRIFLFESVRPKIVTFIDEMHCVGYGYEKAIDVEGYERKVIVFKLKKGKLIKGSNGEGDPRGGDAQSDKITEEDFLGRDVLVKEFSDFYIEYNESNHSPFYFGIFARWGMGKSSIIKMLTNTIEGKRTEKNEYLVCKVDCSLFDKKDKLWIRILNQLVEDISKKEKEVGILKKKCFSFKTRFFYKNFIKWLIKKKKWIGILGTTLFATVFFWALFSLVEKISALRDVTFFITICTALFAVTSGVISIIRENVFLRDHRSEDNSYIRSVNEYKMLIELLNEIEKERDLKILLILDELDRIHKDLLPDIIEFIQLFKGLNEEIVIKEKDSKKNEKAKLLNVENENEKQKEASVNSQYRSTISFAFAFNHDVLFPIIGRNVSLEDKHLFVHSYRNYKGFVAGEDKDAYVDYYKLGKEYMDKYLDLSIYLEESIDYGKLVDKLFKGSNEGEEGPEELGAENEKERTNDEKEELQGEVEEERQELDETIVRNSFTTNERRIIKNTICQYASNVEPRKIIRLKNALLLLKKLNKQPEAIVEEKFEKELKNFILKFLDVEEQTSGTENINNNEVYSNILENNEVASTVEHSSINEPNEYLKFTNYFIHNKDYEIKPSK